jgi:hypothetical protein
MKSLYESILSSTKTGKAGISVGPYKLDMILCAPIDYSSRRPLFYKVVGLKGKSTVIVKELKNKIVSGCYQYGQVMPIVDEFADDKEIRCKLNNRNEIRIEKRYTYEWSGESETCYTD